MIKITLNDQKAIQQLNAIARQLKQPKQLYGALGEELKKIHRKRFEAQESPDGKKWKALSPKYRARKHKNRERILLLRGHLKNQLAYNFDDKSVEFGSARVYARIHQFGSKQEATSERADKKKDARGKGKSA